MCGCTPLLCGLLRCGCTQGHWQGCAAASATGCLTRQGAHRPGLRARAAAAARARQRGRNGAWATLDGPRHRVRSGVPVWGRSPAAQDAACWLSRPAGAPRPYLTPYKAQPPLSYCVKRPERCNPSRLLAQVVSSSRRAHVASQAFAGHSMHQMLQEGAFGGRRLAALRVVRSSQLHKVATVGTTLCAVRAVRDSTAGPRHKPISDVRTLLLPPPHPRR